MRPRFDFRKDGGTLDAMPSTSDRVRGLIQASGLTQREFAARIGLDESKMSKALSGGRRFSSLDLARIADVSQVTVDWLITGEEPPLAQAARTTGGSAGVATREARRLSTLRSDITELGFAQPWRPVEAELRGTDIAQGQALATAALAALRMTDLRDDLAGAVEAVFGADVVVTDLGADFDGLATSSDDVKLILVATSHLPARQRFTIAHELGHLLAGDDQGIHLDEDVYDTARGTDAGERRANAFAAALLMPEDVVRDAVGSSGLTDQAFAVLASNLVVTPSALAYRLKSLRLVDSGTCDRFRRMSAVDAARAAGRSEELARRTTEAGRGRPPGLLARDTYAAYDAGLSTLRPYAQLVGADVDVLRKALESDDGALGVT